MKLLLTSAGITNGSIARELRRLLPRPTADSSVAVVLTAALAAPLGHGNLLTDLRNLHRMGWRRIGLTDLATQSQQQVLRQLRDADVVYLASGDPYQLRYWLDTAGLGNGLPLATVTIAAGTTCTVFSQDMPRRLSAVGLRGHDGLKAPLSDSTGGLPWFVLPEVDFDRWDSRRAESAGFPVFAIDDETAISVDGDEVSVVSEGRWRFLPGALVPTLGESVFRGSEGIRWPEALAIRE